MDVPHDLELKSRQGENSLSKALSIASSSIPVGIHGIIIETPSCEKQYRGAIRNPP